MKNAGQVLAPFYRDEKWLLERPVPSTVPKPSLVLTSHTSLILLSSSLSIGQHRIIHSNSEDDLEIILADRMHADAKRNS